MRIQPTLNNQIESGVSAPTSARPEEAGSPSFADELKSKIGEVNNLQNQADAALKQSSVGGLEGIPETMIKLEEANMGLLLVARVRDKALGAYQQVMQMQF